MSKPTPTRVLLVGMMGAGKSSVGRALATRTGWDYVDNDELVRRAAGVSTPVLQREQGEQELREAESQALSVALSLPVPVIASVAGGVVDDPDDRDRLRAGGYVVWLRARIETLAHRVGSGEGRPWLQPDPEAALRRLYDGRPQRYAEVAALVVDVDETLPDAVAEQILNALG